MSTYPTYKLSDVADILDSSRKPINSTERTKRIQGKTENELYPYYGATGQVGLIDEYLTDGEYVLVGEDGAPFLEPFKNKSYIIRGKAWVNNHAHILSGKKDVLSNQYLNYFLNSFDYRNYVNGTTRLKLTQGNLTQIPFPLPPLPTQHAIVTRIETLFAELDKAVQHLRTAQQQLKTYRQAVLNHWLNNDEGKWEMVKLGNIADVNTGSTPKRGNKDYWENGNIPWITSGETNNPYITKATEFITTKAIAETNCKIIAKGSLVIAMYGEGKTRGKCAELSIDATTNQALASITFTDSRMYKNFAKWFFEKDYEDMRMLSSGGVQPNLNLGIIKNMILPLPPLAEQQRIVQEIESRLSQATATETYIENALQQAEALRQSILKKAFSGELV